MNKLTHGDKMTIALMCDLASVRMRLACDHLTPCDGDIDAQIAIEHLGRALEIIKQKTNGLPQSGETKEDNNGTSNHRPDNPDSGKPHHMDGSETKSVIRSPGGRILPSLPTD